MSYENESISSASSHELNNYEGIEVLINDPIQREPHFLDYDSIPPTGLLSNIDISQENKNFDCRDVSSKISFGAAGYTKKEFTQEDNQLGLNTDTGTKKKHFLDVNPIPPDYMVPNSFREHRSLDRNFERLSTKTEYENFVENRNQSSDRTQKSLRKAKPPSYALSRYLQSDAAVLNGEVDSGCLWRERSSDNNFLYSSMPSKFTMEESLGPKVECVYSLLSMLGAHDSLQTSIKFLDLSRSSDTCTTLRRSGCIPLLVQMVHSENDEQVQMRAAMALHNVVHCNPDEKSGRRETKVLRLIEHIMDYCSFLKTLLQSGGEAIADDADRHPLPAISSLMKVSFDEEHRHAMCQLGAVQAIASLVHLDHAAHGPKREDQCCNSLRRYALMALTNLTFGDGNNKALLCSNKDFMEALVAQLDSAPDDLLQVTASVLRNLSWQADNKMKNVLNEIGTVTALTKTAMRNNNENTLKAILSALWNLSAHCSTNKAEFCTVDGSLAFLVDMLTYEGPSKTLKIIENAGGILRNVSSHIAIREDYRQILRERNCLLILLQQLKSESLTIVSNACGTLWNLSARFPEDQKFLWDNGAVPMLRSLIHSKHKMISEGSSAALKNLLNFRPGGASQKNTDALTKSTVLKDLPSLNARKKKSLVEELDQTLSETCDNLDAISPIKEDTNNSLNNFDYCKHDKNNCTTQSASVSKCESRDSVLSVKSDSCYEKKLRDNSNHSIRFIIKNDEKQSPKENALYTTEFELSTTDSDLEPDCELPINYSVHFTENQSIKNLPKNIDRKSSAKCQPNKFSTYQETDLDQPTDFSLRYAENQIESDCEEKPQAANANEIMLVLEDSVKLYQTEDTPYVISNAASIGDLRNTKSDEVMEEKKVNKEVKTTRQSTSNSITYGCGSYTPEKPINYCEEGTPGYFSRYDSLSSLDENAQNCTVLKAKRFENKPQNENNVKLAEVTTSDDPPISVCENKIIGNSALETPLMFSRRSSIDSLVEEPVTADDKSSIVSDFSRLASGVISPSDIPDSPSQSMSHSPRRIVNMSTPRQLKNVTQQQPLRSVFEDNVNEFELENTPAQFSCATSLSNLSLDDDPKITMSQSLTKESRSCKTNFIDSDKNWPISSDCKTEENKETTLSEGEEESNDDFILETCINIGMNRPIANDGLCSLPALNDTMQKYFTEDTPAELSKVGSVSNLSILSIDTSKGENVNISDVSSNASEAGFEILEQCIRDGMQKTSNAFSNISTHNEMKNSGKEVVNKAFITDPIAMLRRGGLTQYLPVNDEINKFLVEDSPCTFSVASGLSMLTVGSSSHAVPQKPQTLSNNEKLQVIDDSLSSISIESDDDTNLLYQTIAAGCQRSKSNLDWPNRPLSSSQPIPTSSKVSGRKYNHDCSLSSLESSDNDNQSKSLFEQCIRSGMHKQKTISNANSLGKTSHSNPNLKIPAQRCHLPILNSNTKNPVKMDRHRQKEQKKTDKFLLKECINTGMAKSKTEFTKIKSQLLQFPLPAARVVTGGLDQTEPITTITPQSPQNQKNDLTTSVDVLESIPQTSNTVSAPSTAPGVEMKESTNGTKNDHENQITQIQKQQIQLAGTLQVSIQQAATGSNCHVDFDVVLPAEEFLDIQDKKRDPDLMLRSVERLTHDFVSTAEYLRASTNYYEKAVVYNNSNNTWNEDSYSNEVSFPSLSVTAPIVASFNDENLGSTTSEINFNPLKIFNNDEIHDFAEITPTNEVQMFHVMTRDKEPMYTEQMGNMNSSDHESVMLAECDIDNIYTTELNNSNNEIPIQFHVGGAVQQHHFNSLNQCEKSNPFTLQKSDCHSAILPMEVEVNEWTQTICSMAENISVELDNIRPPSCMNSLNNSGFYDISQNIPLSIFQKKSLPAGILARRAITGVSEYINGSIESINSSCNLENIKPPSLMDELLDSMISVASIQSEIELPTNYESAISEIDDNTLLQSCLETFSNGNDSNITPIPSDMSSANSTPRKATLLTPRQKRKNAADRFKTYTIVTTNAFTSQENNSDFNEEDDTFKIEIHNFNSQYEIDTKNPVKFIAPESTCVFHSLTSNEDSDKESSIQALTKQFKFIREQTKKIQKGLETVISDDKTEVQKMVIGEKQYKEGSSIELQQIEQVYNQDTDVGSPKKGPIITKLPDKDSGTDVNCSEDSLTNADIDIKSIRGRRKHLYMSPYRNTNSFAGSLKPKACSEKPTQIVLPAVVKPQKRLPKANGCVGAKSKISITESKSILQRQGTFTKDGPSNEVVPIVDDPVHLPKKLSKIAMFYKAPVSAKVTVNFKSTQPEVAIERNPKIGKKSFSKVPQRSYSNTSIRTSPSICVIPSNQCSTTPPSRSNSNLTSKKISNIGSKIAGIWKSPHESKPNPVGKQKTEPVSTSTAQTNCERFKPIICSTSKQPTKHTSTKITIKKRQLPIKRN